MEAWATLASQLLVRTALAAIPLALVIAAVCRWMPARPATRHTLWLVLLAWFLVSPMLPGLPLWNLLASRLSSADVAMVAESIPSNPSDLLVSNQPTANASSSEFDIDETITDDGPIDSVETCQPRSIFTPIGLLDRAIASAGESLSEWSQRVIAAIPGSELGSDSVATATETDEPSVAAAGETEPFAANADAAPNGNRWSEWTAWLLVLRDAVTRLPALPPAVVFGGVILLCCGHGLRTLLFYRKLRRKIKTPPSVISLVHRCVKRIGLSRMPIVQMTPENVSPMIWCGWQTRLILPAPLWLQLDEVGREAIVCHELAHLRRRDHWWCWGDLLAGTLYWWHPLVWWVRRRLHEEAELSCDAWVIWLLPHGRRAYAEALLRTNETVGRARPVGPAVGMAVSSGRTRQFARRLTMVMTQSTRPRMSFAGLALAMVIAAAGWAAVPARSCPPEATEKEAPVAAVEISDAVDVIEAPDGTVNLVVAQPGALPIGVITSATACPPDESAPSGKGIRTGVSNMAGGGRNLGITGSSDEVVVVEPRSGRTTTIRRAQGVGGGHGGPDRIAHLERQLEELRARVEELSAHIGHGPHAATPRPPMPGRAPMQPRMPSPPRQPSMPREASPPRAPEAPRGIDRRPDAPRARRAPSSDRVVTRSYKLPKGKLDAMWGLMSRSDVPTTVRSIKGGMEVTATEAQHEVFEAFIRLINPQGGPTPRADATGSEGANTPQSRAEAQARAAALRERVRATQARSRAAATERRARQKAHEHQIEQLHHQSESLREHADKLREEASEHDGGHDQSRSKMDNAKSVEQQAKALEQQMKTLEREAVELEKLGDALEEESEALGCLGDTFGELEPLTLARLLVANSQHGDELKTVATSLGNLSTVIESELTAKIEKTLESLNFGEDLGELTQHAKALERLCETLRDKAAEIESAADSDADAETEIENAGR